MSSLIITKGNNFHDFLFTSQQHEIFPRWGLLLKHKNCCERSKSRPLLRKEPKIKITELLALKGCPFTLKSSHYYVFRCRRDDVQEDCDEAIEALIASNDLCGKIKGPDGPFKDAIALMDAEDVQELYDDCVFDVCANYDIETDRNTAVCNAMTNMMTESNDLPIEPVNFRTPTFCPCK